MTQTMALQEDDLYYADTPVGDILRLKRESYDQSLRDIENALHIRSSMLAAIEDGRFEDLPGRTYTIGFIRTYAEYLGLNAERMVKLFKSQASAAPKRRLSSELSPAANDMNVPRLPLVAASLAVFVLALVVMGNQSDSASIQIKDIPQTAPVQTGSIIPQNDGIAANNALNPSATHLYY